MKPFDVHDLDEDGEHDPDACERCVEENHTVTSDCRCGICCRTLLIEASVRDSEREPKIQELGRPIYQPPELTRSGQRELIGYFLNRTGKSMACVFLDDASNRCKIYDTRPLVCRVFDCAGEGREQLIELGILQRDEKDPAHREQGVSEQ